MNVDAYLERINYNGSRAVNAETLTMTAHQIPALFPEGSLREGQHVSLMGADGPGKAEVATSELGRADLFCDDWEQASHGGELAAGVEAGVVTQDRVTEIGRVLAGEAEGRRSAEDITLFDSTGLAIQDLAIAKAALAKAGQLDLPQLSL